MKTQELAELLKKSQADLQKALVEYRSRLQKLRFDLAAGKVKNIREIKSTKKMIARILTVLRNTRVETIAK